MKPRPKHILKNFRKHGTLVKLCGNTVIPDVIIFSVMDAALLTELSSSSRIPDVFPTSYSRFTS